jgi:predicted Zn-dependent peptidase
MRPLATALLTAALLYGAADTGIHIPFEKYKLANGMRVVLARDTAVPVVAVYMVYDVGARSEEKGRIGFAHLFERLMFDGSAHVKKGEHLNYVQTNGGEAIGSTHLDYTEFYDTVPSNQLALALWLESDRMAGLTITEENLKSQKEALQKEKATSFDNQPYLPAISEQWPALIFTDSHNTHSVVGSLDDLKAASVEDAANFYRT